MGARVLSTELLSIVNAEGEAHTARLEVEAFRVGVLLSLVVSVFRVRTLLSALQLSLKV